MQRIFADFNNSDALGRLRLTCVGTIEDLSRSGTVLREGLQVLVYDGDLEAVGTVRYSEDEHIWVAENIGDVRPRR